MDFELQSCSCVWKSLKCQIDIGKNRYVILEQRDQIQTRLLTEVVSSDVTCCYRRSKQIGNYSILIIFFQSRIFLDNITQKFCFSKGKKIVKMFRLQKKKIKKSTSKKKKKKIKKNKIIWKILLINKVSNFSMQCEYL